MHHLKDLVNIWIEVHFSEIMAVLKLTRNVKWSSVSNGRPIALDRWSGNGVSPATGEWADKEKDQSGTTFTLEQHLYVAQAAINS
ncbi:hypothetical protein PoB_003650700 [Plakobranchus ocellatus]|uniref:Uncharacterized protein n=1 Tax=Plakobranchus ocellatus TaxID=259542 RepID=A0AAV4AST9_9GAST|nr:hypothetical protein PoB_003650700 [Plakobranchus ocellatus]